MSNPLPSAQQYGAQTVVKAIGEWKNEQSAAIHLAIWRVNSHPLSNTERKTSGKS